MDRGDADNRDHILLDFGYCIDRAFQPNPSFIDLRPLLARRRELAGQTGERQQASEDDALAVLLGVDNYRARHALAGAQPSSGVLWQH